MGQEQSKYRPEQMRATAYELDPLVTSMGLDWQERCSGMLRQGAEAIEELAALSARKNGQKGGWPKGKRRKGKKVERTA